ncbi:MAG: protein-export chaperone SecB [Elusimicrobia bacterium]|nr:protein-export chaperone SecB [Elusimicrobiota bacterium]
MVDNISDGNADSGITSVFKFLSYKVDSFNYEMIKNLNLLEVAGNIKPALWNFKIGIRQPIYFKDRNYYICGLSGSISLDNQEGNGDKKALISLETGISGIFKVESSSMNRLTKEEENTVVKFQMPAILLPYLRGAITSFLANAGLGSVILPLVNVQALATKALEGLDIQVVENSSGQNQSAK